MSLTQNYKFAKFGPKTKWAPIFVKFVLEQMEYSTWNWRSWSKIIDSGKFGLEIEMCSNFHKI